MKRIALTLVPLTLAGCGKLSEEDAQVVYAQLGVLASEVYTAASNPNMGKAAELTFQGDSTSWTVSGTITDGPTWTGTVHVDGSVSFDMGKYTYDLSMSYEDVTFTSQDFTVNGDMDYSLDMSTQPYQFDYAASGDIDVSGSMSGSVGFDYSCSMDASYTVACTGDFNGTDVSTWSTGM